MLRRVCIVLLALGIATAAIAKSDPRASVEFAKAYRAESTEFGRRRLCLEAIDKKLIYPGVSLSEVNALFGTHLAPHHPSFPESGWRTIDFAEQLKATRDDVQVPYVGWYLALKVDRDGRIWEYHLSNIHK